MKGKWWFRKYVRASELHIYMHPDGRTLQDTERNDVMWAAQGFRFIKTIIKYEWRDL